MVLPRPRDEIEESPPPPYTERTTQPPISAAKTLPQVEEVVKHRLQVLPPSTLYDSLEELLGFL
jgi:hypothetical protein